jgi:polyisoprenoid-binding protein YceI
MTPQTQTQATDSAGAAQGHWRLDPVRSRVEFHVRNFYGLMTVKGRFTSYDGTLELGAQPVVHLIIDAASLDTGHAKRDKHLRSADFFDVERHAHVRFTSGSASADGDSLKVRGQLHAAGKQIPLELDAAVRSVDGELEVEAVTYADQRQLGMTWSPLAMVRAPSKLIVRARLIREEGAAVD